MISGTVDPSARKALISAILLGVRSGLRPQSGTPALVRLLDAVHLAFAADVILELGYQRQNAHHQLAGAGGGAPKGKANGAWKHGHYSQSARVERFLVKRVLKDAASLQKLLSESET